jgi:UDP-glucuronate 4-epimerase
MSVVVTGGLGFIGAHVAAALMDSGEEVVIVDSLTDYYSVDLKLERKKHLLGKAPKENFFEFDLVDRISFSKILDEVKPRTVIHLAAQAGVRLPVELTHKYVESNLTGFSNVLQSVIEHRIPDFLYASSSSVYGDSTDVPYRENAVGLSPISFYGATKLSNELLAKALTVNSQTRSRGMRFFTVYGPWGRPDMAYFRLGASVLTDYNFHRFGDGSVRRDFTYVEDTVKGILSLSYQLAKEDSGFSDIVNLGGGNPHSLNDLIAELEKISGKRIAITNEKKATGDVLQTVADSSYLRQLTGFVPSISLSEGVSRFYDWANLKESTNSLKKWIG